MSGVIERFLPARLGTGFRWLLTSSWTTNLGDGFSLAAGPLLVASETDSAFLVALAALLQWLPKLLFGLPAGVLADRVDRRGLLIAVNLLRSAVLMALVVALVTDLASIGLVLTIVFLLGTAETFADNTSMTLLPMLVPRDDLALGNARLMTGFITLNTLAGPPIGAALFSAGRAWPFVANAVLMVAAVTMLWPLPLPPHGRVRAERAPARQEIAEGLRWVRRHAAVRTLVLTIFIFNVTFGAAWSVLVLYARERLGLGDVGFGAITTVMAVGGLVSTVAYGWLTRRISLGGLMRVGLVIETITHLALALTTTPWVAMPVFFAFGAHAFVWSTTSTTIRQRAVPSELQGRVNGINVLGVFGGLVIGSALGGVIAQRFSVVAPFWFAFAGSALFVALIWRSLRHIAHDDATGSPASATEPGSAT